MTEGSSQGLFVIVAVVIFGIFVAIAYTLFEDTLNPAMASIFRFSTEQVNTNLKGGNIIQAKDFKLHGIEFPNVYSDLYVGFDSISYSSSGQSYIYAPYIPSSLLEPNKKYVLTYDIKDLGGTVETLGGHCYFASNLDFYIDGVYMGNYHMGAKYPTDGATHKIRVAFDTDNYANYGGSENYIDGIAIHPNRHYNDIILGEENLPRVPAYKVSITNIQLVMVD